MEKMFGMKLGTLSRSLMAAVMLGSLAAPALSATYAAKDQFPLELVAQSPTHLWNAITVTDDGRMFAGMPRWPGFEVTPGLVEIKPDGSLVPYPGGKWNQWKPGDDARKAFVQVNAVHGFDGQTFWVVDQGTAPGDKQAKPGEQKLVQIDSRTNKVIRSLSFGPEVMPAGASFNDLRIHGDWAYLTESGLGSVIVVNLKTGKGLRRLADDPTTKQVRPKVGRDNKWMVLPDGTPQITNADPIELSPDGAWLYYQPASGPLYRVPTAGLRDASLSEADLSKQVEFVYDTGTLGGTAMDDQGNLFLAEADHARISVLKPDGSLHTLVQDDRLWGGDALFITKDGYLYIPIAQVSDLKFLQGPGGQDHVTYPFKIWRLKLPAGYGGPIAP